LRKWIDLSFRHTWVNPLVLLFIILSTYLVKPTPENPVHHAIFLSYPLPPEPGADPAAPIKYGKGKWDIAFVAFYTIFLSFTREFLMQRLLKPMALYFDIKGRNKQNRFMEQAYTAIYFGLFGPYGLYVMSRTNIWYFNTTAFFEGFPHRNHEAVFKTYYLLEASYWAQQAIVLLLQLEKPRKDFKELVGHHIITLALIALSYRFHFTHMGLAVYITHDISDFFLAVSVSPLSPHYY
jgi:acyl-CoA-dependent ceramide synthase